MKKERIVLVLCFLFIIIAMSVMNSSFVLSATNATNATNSSNVVNNTAAAGTFEKSYNCLKSKVDERTPASMTVEELAFSLLALGYDSTRQKALKSELESRKDSSECWPKTACNAKETSLVFMAFYHIGANTDKIEDWLLSQTTTPNDIVWYLQIDNPSNELAKCTITYDNSSKSITISPEKKITGAPGACFTLGYSDYFLEVKPTCYDKEIDISCDKDFFTSTLYKKRTDNNKFYVSTMTSSAPPGGKTTEKIESLCVKQGSVCNYEASLWATLALNKKNSEFKGKTFPYLLGMAYDSSNKRYLPSAFLYALTGFDEYFSELTNEQNKLGYWQISDTSKRYYDTAIALMSLYGKAGQADSAVAYILTPNVQGNGCWGNSIRDTAFLLYAANPKSAASSGGLTTRTLCENVENVDYSCAKRDQCDEVNGTDVGSNFYCVNSGDICCSEEYVGKTCSQKNGNVCLSTQECIPDGFITSSDNTYCCLGECQEKQVVNQDTCSLQESQTCREDACVEGEEEKLGYTCASSSEVCCAPKQGRSLWWLWLLIILIILIVVAIIFRNQLKVWLFKIKSKFSKEPVGMQARPGFPPRGPGLGMPPAGFPGQRRMMPPGMRPMPQGQRSGMPQARPFPKDKELDATLKKLKDMGK